MSGYITRSQQLHENLAKIIASAQPGERLPTEPSLAKQLGVSRATLREAMRTFETQGLIHRRQGSGTYVLHPSYVIETGLEVLESIETIARRIGLEVSVGELKIEPRHPTEDEARILSLTPDSKVLVLTRVIVAEGSPVAYLVDSLPQDFLSMGELDSSFTGSVLDLLLKRGTPRLNISRTEINAVTAQSEVARALRIQRGDVLLRFVAYLYADTGQVVDYSFSYFLPGYFKFHVIRRVGQF
jgi:GntR family transcriptional regulator